MKTNFNHRYILIKMEKIILNIKLYIVKERNTKKNSISS